jgi:transcriptional antiterminator NusG
LGNKAQPLRKAEVDRILGPHGPGSTVSNSTGHAVQIPYKPGDAVRINEGPFKDFDGTVEEVHADKGKLKVLVSVFGRSTPSSSTSVR